MLSTIGFNGYLIYKKNIYKLYLFIFQLWFRTFTLFVYYSVNTAIYTTKGVKKGLEFRKNQHQANDF